MVRHIGERRDRGYFNARKLKTGNLVLLVAIYVGYFDRQDIWQRLVGRNEFLKNKTVSNLTDLFKFDANSINIYIQLLYIGPYLEGISYEYIHCFFGYFKVHVNIRVYNQFYESQ